MKMRDLHPGDMFVDAAGHRWEAVSHDVEVDAAWKLSAETLTAAGVTAAPGKGGAAPRVQVLGPRSRRSGLLAVSRPWTPSASSSLVLVTSGRELHREVDFVAMWEKSARRTLARSLDHPDTFLDCCVVVAHPSPVVTGHMVTSETWSANGLRFDTHVTVREVDVAAPFDVAAVTVESTDGERHLVAARTVVVDRFGLAVDAHRRRVESAATSDVRDRLRSVLRSLASAAGDDPKTVNVDVDGVTVGYRVLESLVLADEYTVAAMLDASAELADVIAELRRSRLSR